MYTNFEMMFPHNEECFNGMCYIRDGTPYIYMNDKYIPAQIKFKPDKKMPENVLSNGLRDYFGHFNYCDDEIAKATYNKPEDTFLVRSGSNAFVITVLYLIANGFNIRVDKNAYFEQRYLIEYLIRDDVYGFDKVPDVDKVAYVCSPICIDGERRDIKEMAKEAHSRGGVLVVDNTYLTSTQYNPFTDDADIVIDSLGKYYTSDYGIPSGLLVFGERVMNPWIIDMLCMITCSFADKQTKIAVKDGIRGITDKLSTIQKNAKIVNSYLRQHGVVTKFPGIGGLIWIYNVNVMCHDDFKFIQPNDAFGLSHTVYTIYMEEERGVMQYVLRLSCGIEDPKEYISDLQTIINANG